VDALEDWEDFEALAHHAREHHGEEGLAHIHPFGGELLHFRDEAMPRLKARIPMYADFPSYINTVYQSLQMEHIPFPDGNQYERNVSHAGKIEYAFTWYSQKCELLKVKI
jgi:hypothetical protein